MRKKEKLKAFISYAYSLGHLSPKRKGHRNLMYHSIEEKVEMDPQGFFTLSLKNFSNQIDELVKNKSFKITPFQDPPQNNGVSITFDDGYKNNLTIAAPKLCKLGLPFTVFVTSRFIKENHRDFLSVDELKELSQLPGVTIGAHGKNHLRLTALSTKEIEEELKDSKKYLEDIIDKEVATMSYPHGDVDKKVMKMAGEVGYKKCGTSFFDINRTNKNPLLTNRCEINGWDDTAFFKQKLHGYWDWYRFIHYHKNLIKRIFP